MLRKTTFNLIHVVQVPCVPVNSGGFVALSFTSETVNILIAGLVSIKASAVPCTTVCSWWDFSFRSAWYDHVFVQAIFLVLA